jgi:hypothetical protein
MDFAWHRLSFDEKAKLTNREAGQANDNKNLIDVLAKIITDKHSPAKKQTRQPATIAEAKRLRSVK